MSDMYEYLTNVIVFFSSFENNYRWILKNCIHEERMNTSASGQDGLTWTITTLLCETANKTQSTKQKKFVKAE